jgi:hypothetical protein
VPLPEGKLKRVRLISKRKKMDNLEHGLKQLRHQVPESNTTSLYDAVLRKALVPQMPVIQFNQLKKIAAAVAALVLINTSVVFWSLHRNNTEVNNTPNNAYLQSYNLSIY